MPAETDDHGYITTPSNAVTPTGTSGQTVTHTSTQQHTHTHTMSHLQSLTNPYTNNTTTPAETVTQKHRLSFMPETDGHSRVQPYSDREVHTVTHTLSHSHTR